MVYAQIAGPKVVKHRSAETILSAHCSNCQPLGPSDATKKISEVLVTMVYAHD